jgi:quinol monooxygenase YgiN
MATVVFIHRLQPADGKRDALIGLLREFADSINADPECLHYSVHEPIDDEATPLTVIQAHTSVAGFEKHGEWMAPNIPRLVPLLASAPDPPVRHCCAFPEQHRSMIRMLCWVQMVSARSSNATRSLWRLRTSVAMS